MKVVEEDATEKLHESKLSPYIEEASYKAGGKKEDGTLVNIYINADEEFADLSTLTKYEVMRDTITKLIGSSNKFECGNDNYCNYSNLHVSYDHIYYTMDVVDKSLIINDDERYTEENYKYDMDQINKKDATEKYEENYSTTPSSSTEQGASSTYDPKKDSANYDANGNYKPVDQMTPEEIKKEVEGMLEDSLKR